MLQSEIGIPPPLAHDVIAAILDFASRHKSSHGLSVCSHASMPAVRLVLGVEGLPMKLHELPKSVTDPDPDELPARLSRWLANM